MVVNRADRTENVLIAIATQKFTSLKKRNVVRVGYGSFSFVRVRYINLFCAKSANAVARDVGAE